MLFSLYTIKDNVTRIKTLNDQVKEDAKIETLDTARNKFYAFAYDLSLAVAEAYFTTSIDSFNAKYNNVLIEISNAQKANTIIEFKTAMENIIAEFELVDYKELSSYDLNYLANRWHFACYRGEQKELMNTIPLYNLAQQIEPIQNRKITMFYPDCSDGENIKQILGVHENILAYGNEANNVKLSQAKSFMHKVVKGILRGSRIQNNAFDLMYVQPKFLLEIDEEDFLANKRIERNYILDMFKYVRTDGVMIITLPYTRLFKDLCSMLSKHLKNIEVVKVSGEEFSNLGLVHIIGQKETVKEPRPEEYAKLRRLFEHTRIKEYRDVDTKYVLPRSNSCIDLFKGSALDLEEIEQIVDKSSLMDKMWESQKVEKLDENIKNPLLPFNIGQLGLVLTSGCLDGIVDEQDGNYHLIKGRVSKQIIEAEVEKEGKIEITETTVNKVEINVLLPNGEFKVLA